MKRIRAIFLRNVHAQSMVEVGIFGSVIIFLVAALVKNVVTTSFSQQYALRTMREALTIAQNKRDAGKDPIGDPVLVQKPYNLTIIEDRLFPGVTKYGVTERTPYITSTNAVFSKDLFGQPYDLVNAPGSYGNRVDVPVLNMRINGFQKKPPFTLGAWMPFGTGNDLRCDVAVRNSPGGGMAWKRDSSQTLKDIIKHQGRAICIVGGFPTPVFQKLPSDPAEYYMMDPRAGDINPYDPSQGLQPDVQIITNSNGTLTVPADKKPSTAAIHQTDSIRRKIMTNKGAVFIDTSIGGPARSHTW